MAVAYVYCEFNTWDVPSAATVLGSVLGQVVGASTETPDEVQNVFEPLKKQADGCELRLPEILDRLTSYLISLKRCFICIDALDELSSNHRAQLWSSLQRIVLECPNTRLFLTGRPHISMEVEDYLPEEAAVVAIEPTSDDIRRYMEEKLEEDPDMSAMGKQLRLDITRVIPKMAMGMYVFARDVGFHRLG